MGPRGALRAPWDRGIWEGSGMVLEGFGEVFGKILVACWKGFGIPWGTGFEVEFHLACKGLAAMGSNQGCLASLEGFFMTSLGRPRYLTNLLCGLFTGSAALAARPLQ